MATIGRVPFGELSSGRLQQLASIKNCQNGIVAQDVIKPSLPTPTKRSYAMTTLGEDSENVDPVQFSSPKKNKFELFSTPVKPLSFVKPTITTAPRLLCVTTSVPARAPLSAPAGRSPKRKTIGFATKPRRTFTRIDPPSFASRSDALPFSLDAALSSTLGKSKPVPSKWKFEIHVDTPEEEAGILMEHSTLTLDISSDDESKAKDKLDCGKENVAPEGYTTPVHLSRAGERAVKFTDKLDIVRKKIETDEMDDGQRSPLSNLEVEPFNTLEEGEEKYINVDAEATPSRRDFIFTVTAPAGPHEPVATNTAAVSDEKKEEVIVFDDSTLRQDALTVEIPTVPEAMSIIVV